MQGRQELTRKIRQSQNSLSRVSAAVHGGSGFDRSSGGGGCGAGRRGTGKQRKGNVGWAGLKGWVREGERQ